VWTRVYAKLEKAALARFVAADKKVLNADMKRVYEHLASCL
jgi:hypothetical protein